MKVNEKNTKLLDNTKQQVKQQDPEITSFASINDLEVAFAETLLDQVDTAQQQIRDIQNDIALLQTMENALCLISENMAKIKRLANDMLNTDENDKLKNVASDAIRNLVMINMLISEDTEFNGHLLFKDDIITLSSSELGELTLETVKIPEVCGVENGDFQAMLDSMESVARIINLQYQRINNIMLTLLDTYRQVRTEINVLRKAYPLQIND